MRKVYILVVVVFSYIERISACNGYNLKMASIKNCEDASVIQIQPAFDVTMDKDCNLVFSGCVNVTKAIKTSPGTYLMKKSPLPPIDGEIDYCEAITMDDIPTIKQTLAALGVPKKCPVAAKTYCSLPNNKVSISLFKNQLGLASGKTSVKLTANHDSGKTCVEFSFSISKARRG